MPHKKIYIISLVASMGGFLFGFDASVISGVITFIDPYFQMGDVQLGWVVSSPTFSAMFAMLGAGWVSDRIGRKKTLILVAFLYIVSSILSATSQSLAMLVTARMLGGVAFGTVLIVVPVYLAEISPAAIRGRLVSIQQLNIVLGFSAAYFSNYIFAVYGQGLEFLHEENIWRWMLGVEAVPALIYFCLIFFIPQSPRWLYLKGWKEEAKGIFSNLMSAENAKNLLRDIEVSVSSQSTKARLNDLIKNGMAGIFLIGLTLGVVQQITGINVIFFYAPTIFEQAGFGADVSFAQAILVGIINIIFTIIALVLIDKIGRKPLLLGGLLGIMLSLCVTSYGFHQSGFTLKQSSVSELREEQKISLYPMMNKTYTKETEFRKDLRSYLGEEMDEELENRLLSSSYETNFVLVLAGILGFVASFAVSLGPVMWVLLSELFPNYIRGLAISIIGFANALVSWFVQFIFPLEVFYLGNASTYLIYAIFAGIGWVIFYRYLPETKGKSLEEIEFSILKK